MHYIFYTLNVLDKATKPRIISKSPKCLLTWSQYVKSNLSISNFLSMRLSYLRPLYQVYVCMNVKPAQTLRIVYYNHFRIFIYQGVHCRTKVCNLRSIRVVIQPESSGCHFRCLCVMKTAETIHYTTPTKKVI